MHCLFPVVVTSLEQVVIILLQAKVDDGNRLASYKLFQQDYIIVQAVRSLVVINLAS